MTPVKKVIAATPAMIGKGVRVTWTDAAAKEVWHTTTDLLAWVKEGLSSGHTYGILHSIESDFLVVIGTRLGPDDLCHSWKIPIKLIKEIVVVDKDPPT